MTRCLAVAIVYALLSPSPLFGEVAANAFFDENMVGLKTSIHDNAERASGSGGEPSRGNMMKLTREQKDVLLRNLNDQNCRIANLNDAIINLGAPETLTDMEDYVRLHKGAYRLLPPEESIFHNFKEDAITPKMSFDERLDVMQKAYDEYYNKKPEEWKYLDPQFPNVKYVSRDYHNEIVYNRCSGEKISTGINAGTANAGSGSNLGHLGDVTRYPRCLTPAKEDIESARALLSDPRKMKRLIELLKLENQTRLDNEMLIARYFGYPAYAYALRQATKKENREMIKTVKALGTKYIANRNKTKFKPDTLSVCPPRGNMAGAGRESGEKSRNIAIDMSKIESLVEKKLALLRKALDQGKTLDNRHSLLLEINAVTKEIWVESLRLDKDFEKQTAGLSPDEKMKVCNSALAKVIPLLQETDKTLNKLIARKIIPGCEPLAEWKQYIEKENAKSKAMPDGNPR